jgi:lipoprotein-releasing system permease protein
VFTVQGAAIGVIGTLVGLAIGLFLVAYLGNIVGFIEAQIGIDLLSAEAYLIGDLATEARFAEVAQVCLIAFGLAILATIYPASLAARQPPAEALRYE